MNNIKKPIPISVVISTRNEEQNIVECIKSLQMFSQVVVVDSFSTDKTVELANILGAGTINFKWNGKYPKKKQWILENVPLENEWVLFIDADERVPESLSFELASMNFEQLNHSGYIVELDYVFFGKVLKYGQRPSKLALMKIKDSYFPPVDDLEASGMGELEGHYQPHIIGTVGRLRNRILHQDNDPFESWVLRHLNYAKWESFVAKNNSARGVVLKNKTREGKMFHKLPLKPIIFFLNSFFLKLGFLDGRAGLNYALAKSWYYWLISALIEEGRIE